MTLFSVLLAENLLGQAASLSGSGTSSDPYLITSAEDWNAFADEANSATYWASGVYVQLDADIPVSGMVGVWSATESERIPYSGTFDGNWHTLTFTQNTTDDYCAPFRYIDGATIANITIKGSITTNQQHAAGIVGYSIGTNYITNCTSSIAITSNVSGQGEHGGLVARQQSGTINFKNCMFDGSITGCSTTKCAGFVGWVEKAANYNTCSMAGTISISNTTSNFHRNHAATTDTIEIYYVTNYNIGNKTANKLGPRGDRASTSEYNRAISKKYHNDADDNDYYVKGVIITGLEHMVYNGEKVLPTVTYYGKMLVKDDDYTLEIKRKEGVVYVDVDKAQDPGEYKVKVTGNNDNGYYGSQTFEF